MVPLRYRRIGIGVSIIAAVAIFEPFTPAHTLSLALYYEARDEPWIGRRAVAATIFNRRDDRRFPNTVAEVVNDGRERGRLCDFSFMCDGKSDLPWVHHYSKWGAWLRSRFEGYVYSGFDALGIYPDPTGGALFYKRTDARSPYFTEKIRLGEFERVSGSFGAHEFFLYRK